MCCVLTVAIPATSYKTIIMDKTQIEKNIESIRKAGLKLDKLIQETGLATLAHIDAHGDVRLMNRLYLALPRGARKAAFSSWALAFGKVVANTGDNKKENPFAYAKDRVSDLAQAAVKPWYDFKPDPEPDQLFDVVKAINSIIARAGKADKVSDPKLLEALQQMAASGV